MVKKIKRNLAILMTFAIIMSTILPPLSVIAGDVSYSWVSVGNKGFTDEMWVNSPSLAFDDDGTPYVAYKSEMLITVMKFNGQNWEVVGTKGFANGGETNISFAIDNGTPYVAYREFTNYVGVEKATVVKYDGENWVKVGGDGFSEGSASGFSLAFNEGTPYVAYNEHLSGTGSKATVMKWNGTSWEPVGNPRFSDGDPRTLSLAFGNNGTPYLAYADYFQNNFKPTVMKLDGSNWTELGSNGISVGGAIDTSLAFDDSGTPYVAYQDFSNSNKATVMKWNETESEWESVGPKGFSVGEANTTSLAFDSGTPYVAYLDHGNGYNAIVKKWNGTSWESVGTKVSDSGGSNTSLAFYNGTPYVVYNDSLLTSRVTVMKLASTPILSSNADLSDLTLSEGTLSFASGTTNYTASVGNAVTSIDVTATVGGTTATLQINGTPVTSGNAVSVPLNVGENLINILVTAQNGTTKPYMITVVRAAIPSSVEDNTIPESELTTTENSDGTVTITGYSGSGRENLIIPDIVNGKTVSGIGAGAFADYVLTGSITIPESVTSIENWAFSYNRLSTLTILNKEAVIGENAFSNQSHVQSVTIKGYKGSTAERYVTNLNDSFYIFIAIPYTVSFNVDGGSAVTNIAAHYDTTITSPAAPTKTGYTFGGWFKESGLTTQWNFTTDKVTENRTLYAKWIAISTGDGGGGSSTPTPSQPGSQVITVPVETGNVGSGTTVTQTPITRTTDQSGKVKDEVTLTTERARETTQSITQSGQNTARIVIPDTKDEVGQVNINVPKEATKEFGDININLEIFTDNVRIIVPQSSMDNFLDDLFFRVIPIKEEQQRKEVENRARVEQIVKQVAKDDNINVVSRPMTIETNMQSRPVTLVLPLRDVQLPTNAADRAKFLNELVIFIEHSDGEKRLVKGKVVDYKEGQLGIEFGVNKFSTFTILHMEGFEGNFHEAYIKGFEDGTFKPTNTVTRAEIAAMITRNLGYDDSQKATHAPFLDVQATHWAAGAIDFAKQQGLMKGDNTGNFNPNAAITRAEMASIVARYKQLTLLTEAESIKAFPDIAGHWAIKDIAANKQAGIINGYEDGTFRPNGSLNRAEAVKVINRMFDRGPLYGVTTPSFKDVPTTHWAFNEVEEAAKDHFFTTRLEGGENIIK